MDKRNINFLKLMLLGNLLKIFIYEQFNGIIQTQFIKKSNDAINNNIPSI